MDIFYTVLAVTVSLLSVFGLWCAVKFPLEAFFASGQVVAAVELRNEKDAEMLDVLLHEAHSAFFRKGMPFEKVLELLARYGAEYRIIS